MYDTFKQMVKDIFENEDFIQYCYINGIKYTCLASGIDNDLAYTQVGLSDYVNFTLDIEIEQFHGQFPQPNDKIIFRDTIYKVSHTNIDSALATIKIFLISTSKGK